MSDVEADDSAGLTGGEALMRLLISERFPLDRRVLHAEEVGGPAALGLWLVAASWCAQFETDVIDVRTAHQLTTIDDDETMIEALVTADLWEVVPHAMGAYAARSWRVLHEGDLWCGSLSVVFTPGAGAKRGRPPGPVPRETSGPGGDACGS